MSRTKKDVQDQMGGLINYIRWMDLKTQKSCDGIDSDCDGSVDEGLIPPLSSSRWDLCGISWLIKQGK